MARTGGSEQQRPIRPILFLVPGLMLVLAGVQISRVVALDQSSWIGGGFGMFATYDYDDTRVVVARWQTPDGFEPAEAAIGANLLLRARVVPTEDNLLAVADAIIEAGGGPEDAIALGVEVRGRVLEGDTLTFPVLAFFVVAV